MTPSQVRGLTSRNKRLTAAAIVSCFVLVCTFVVAHVAFRQRASVGAPSAGIPISSGTPICGQPILHSPYNYQGSAGFHPTGTAGLPTYGRPGSDFPDDTKIVVIPTGDNTSTAATGGYEANHTVFYFEPGIHVVKGVMYTGVNSVYIGGYSRSAGVAVINGVNGGAVRGVGGSSLSSSRAGIVKANETWEYLTIENYASSQNNVVMGDENGGSFDDGNTYKYDTIGPNEYGYVNDNVAPATGESNGGGYGIGLGSDTTIEFDCLTRNAQGAFNGGGTNITISHNEISRNGLGEYPDTGGAGGSPYSCGCSGGGKLFFSVNPVITHNYVHDNYNTGIWLDFDNTGADISYNYVASNWGSGIAYEASYNANISHNTLVGNGWASDGAWPTGVRGKSCYGGVTCTNGNGPITGAGGGFPYAALDLSNSGGNSSLHLIAVPHCSSDCTVNSKYSGALSVKDNVFLNNFGGVMVYTDTNRYPGNIDNDSSCSIPLGPLSQANSKTYFQQTRVLTTVDARISGTSVKSPRGIATLCSNYGGAQGGDFSSVVRSPAAGMAVFNLNTGALIGTVASVSDARAFTLDSPAKKASDVSLVLSAYGGCGPADYYGGGPGKKSGKPAAYYWDNCIWGSRNIVVSNNSFSSQSDRITGCTVANMCGFMANVAFNAGVPPLMQFFDSYSNLIANASGELGNVWSENTYSWSGSHGRGQWKFWPGIQGHEVSLAQWEGFSLSAGR